jgi:hypothetical protein
VRPRPAVKISTQPAYPVLLPGQPATVHVQLHNHLDRPVEGIVSLAPEPGLHADWEGLRRAFRLEAQGYAGLPLVVTCQDAGAVPLRLSASIEVGGEHISGRAERVPLFSLPPGGVVADIGESGDAGAVAVVENEFFRLHCRQEGGRCAVWDKVHHRAVRPICGAR